MSFTGASSEELPRVVRAYDLHILVGRPCSHSVFYLLSLGGEKTWGLVVEGKADRVKDGAFACSGLSADEEEGLVCKWGRREVQECIFDGCYIVYFKYFRCCPTVPGPLAPAFFRSPRPFHRRTVSCSTSSLRQEVTLSLSPLRSA